MQLADFITADAVLLHLKPSSKKQLLQQIATSALELLPTDLQIDAKGLTHILLEREKIRSTGMGRGIAIPHGRMEGLERIFGLFTRLDTPVPYDAVDRHPVDLVFLLLSPVSAGVEHLRALARIARSLREDSLCAKIRGARDQASLYALLADA